MSSIRPFEQHRPQIAEDVYIDNSAVIIGDVHIGVESSIWPASVIRGDIHQIRIGARSNIQDGSVLHVTHASDYCEAGMPLTIGNDVTIGHKAILHGCTIGDLCLIGMGAIIMDGATIPAETMLAAGSIVPPGKTLESGHLWVGSPARKVRPLSEQERAYLPYSAQHYVRLAQRYRRNPSGDP